MGVLQGFFVVLFTCVSLSIGKHHHHRLHHGLLHNRKGLNVGENMKWNVNETIDYEPGMFEIAKNKDDIAVTQKRDSVINEKLTKINEQLNKVMTDTEASKSLMTEVLKTNMKDPLEDIKSITGDIEKTFPALESLAEGIKSKDGFKIATSVLAIAAVVSAAVGGPIGLVIATVLNFAVVLINIFKPVEKVESQEEMLQRVISNALQEFRQTSLIADFSGFTKKHEILRSNLKAVDEFLELEMKNVGSESNAQKYITTGDPNQQFSNLQSTMANEIMPLANDVMYDGVILLGKIQYEINNVCDVDNSITDDKKREEIAEKCLKMLQLYCEMSFQRRFSFTAHLIQTLQKVVESKTVDEITKAKAITHIILVSDSIQITEKQDIKVLEFLVKPINNYKRRYVINYYYSYLHQYKHLSQYVSSLDIQSSSGVFVCSEESLLGVCKELSVKDDTDSMFDKEVSIETEAFVPMSIMVPAGYTVRVIMGTSGKLSSLNTGNYVQRSYNNLFKVYGATTVSCLYYKDRGDSNFKEIVVTKSTHSDSVDAILKMCRLNSDSKKNKVVEGLRPPHRAICRDILVDKMKVERFTEHQDDFQTYKSFNIPNSHAVIGKADLDGMTFYWGPFYGSRNLPKACASALWRSVIVVDYSDKDQMESLKTKLPICQENENLEICGLKNIDSSTQFLEMCKEKDFKGYCDSVPIKLSDSDPEQIINLDFIHVYAEKESKLVDYSLPTLPKSFGKISISSDFDDCIWEPKVVKKTLKNVLKSLKVPAGVKVELWRTQGATGALYGTYLGPADIGNIDGNKNEASMITSLKITKHPAA